MGLFEKIFKGVGKVVSTATKVVGTVAKVASPLIAGLPVVGPIASKIVDKLPLPQLKLVSDQVKESALVSVLQAAAAPAATRPEALQLASEAKQNILVQTGNPELADQVGQATYEAASAPALPSVHINDLGKVLAASTESGVPLAEAANQVQEEKSKTLLGKVLQGAFEGAKDGAIDPFLETPQGKTMQTDAINSQVNKYLPMGLAALCAYLIIKKR